MFIFNPLQAKGLFTFVSTFTMGLSPVVDPLLNSQVTLNPPPAMVQQLQEVMVLSVPFSSQAPEANWEQPFGDACEETSILMVDRFYKGNTQDKIETQEATEAILNIIRSKEASFGPSFDENLLKVKQMIELINSNWMAEIKEDPTLEEIKNQLQQNHPVIVPVSYFPNSHYLDPLDYHMLVLTGFNNETGMFTLNDPGTRWGDGMEFAYEVVMEKMHDLNKPDYEAGPKRVLFTQLKE